MKRFAQIAAVAGALSMLVGFVVYSQQKAVQPDDYFKTAPTGTSTNVRTRATPAPPVAPGSKVLAPLVSPTAPVVVPNHLPTSPALPVGPGTPVSDVVAESSKSARVIKPAELAPRNLGRLQAAVSDPPPRHFMPTGRVMFSTKSAPVITPSTLPNQHSVAMATNPPPRKPAP